MATTTFQIPQSTFPVGTNGPFGPFAVPTGATAAQLVIDRVASLNGQPNTVSILAELQFSQDGGSTWTPLGQYNFTTVGGSVVYNGQVATTSGFSMNPMPGDPANASREARVVIVVAGQAVTTSGTLKLS